MSASARSFVAVLLIAAAPAAALFAQDDTDRPRLPQPELIPTPFGPPQGGDLAPQPKLRLTPESWDFGAKFAGEPAETEIVLENVGQGPLRFTIRSSCGCTAVAALTQAQRVDSGEFQYELAPGKADKLKITYNTRKNTKTVSQIVTISSNDPERPTVNVQVSGTIKQLFETTVDDKPQDRIMFTGVERKSRSTSTMRITCTGDEPTRLLLRPPNTEVFDVELTEVHPGREYLLTVITKPPLNNGMNSAEAVFETDNKLLPELRVPISAYIQPRVSITRPTLSVAAGTNNTVKQRLQLRYRGDTPVNVTGFECTHSGVKAEVLPKQPQAGPNPIVGAMSIHDIEVSIPPATELPQEGAVLTILTDDADPDYQRFPVKIAVVQRAKPRQTVVSPVEGATVARPAGEAPDVPQLPAGPLQPNPAPAQPGK